jgi:hypothetical protein
MGSCGMLSQMWKENATAMLLICLHPLKIVFAVGKITYCHIVSGNTLGHMSTARSAPVTDEQTSVGSGAR